MITEREHYLIHFGTEAMRRQYGFAKGWKNLEKLKKSLKTEYSKL
jgi:hypothetical protein